MSDRSIQAVNAVLAHCLSGNVFLVFRARLFLSGISFFFFGKARGAKPPITFCELPRAADRTPYLVGLRTAAWLTRVPDGTDNGRAILQSICAALRALLRSAQIGIQNRPYANGRSPKKIDCAAAVSVVDEQLSAANSCAQPARAAITSENVVNVE